MLCVVCCVLCVVCCVLCVVCCVLCVVCCVLLCWCVVVCCVLCVVCCVLCVVCCVVCCVRVLCGVGSRGRRPKPRKSGAPMGESEGWEPRGMRAQRRGGSDGRQPEGWGSQHVALFFILSRPNFPLFSLLGSRPWTTQSVRLGSSKV